MPLTDDALTEELAPVVAGLFDRHLTNTKEWFPHRLVPWSRGRDIELRLIPDTSPHARFSLRSVQIVATGDAPGTFMVERTDNEDIVTTSETPENPAVSRMVYSQRPSSGDMIGQELQRFGADGFYEEAVRFAVRLVPA